MEINNLEQILDLLKFDNQEDFYFMQIIMRRKENDDLESNSRVIKTYYIQNKQYLLDMFEEIKGLCNYFNARACISLNRRNFEKTAFQTMKKIVEQICNKDFFNVMNAYDKSCGAYQSESDKKWIIDLDREHYQMQKNIYL